MKEVINVDNRQDIERLAKVEGKLESIEQLMMRVYDKLEQAHSDYVTKADLDEKLKSRDEKIDELRKSNKWLFRTVLGGFILGFISLLFFYIEYLIQGGITP